MAASLLPPCMSMSTASHVHFSYRLWGRTGLLLSGGKISRDPLGVDFISNKHVEIRYENVENGLLD